MSDHGSNLEPAASEATILLQRVQSGDDAAAEDLLPLVYEQLRAMAGSFFRQQRSDHTLQPTALVHEAYLKLVGGARNEGRAWEGRSHFCAVAAKAMRQILHDHARAKKAAKRDPGGARVEITQVQTPSSGGAIALEALDEGLTKLSAIDERGARIVELRFFGGLTNEEIARMLDVSLPTVERSWRRNRAWLKAHIEEPTNASSGEETG